MLLLHYDLAIGCWLLTSAQGRNCTYDLRVFTPMLYLTELLVHGGEGRIFTCNLGLNGRALVVELPPRVVKTFTY